MFRFGFKKRIMELGVNYESSVLAAVSGGVDSMCMLDALVHSSLDLRIAVAHVNFNLRGEESDGDTAMVEEWCATNGVKLYKESFDTIPYAQENGISIEMAARELRYKWFYSLMESEGFEFLAIAHNANDNAETLLLNLTRGCGIDGIAGIREKIMIPSVLSNEESSENNTQLNTPQFIIRPLLVYNRKQIEKYALKYKIPYRIDSTNMISDYSRNRIRNEVFPQLEKINPSVIEVFNRDIRHFMQAGNVIQELINEKVSNLTHKFNCFKDLYDSKFGHSMCSLNLRMNCGMKGVGYPYICENYLTEDDIPTDESDVDCNSPDEMSEINSSDENESGYNISFDIEDGERISEGVSIDEIPSILVCIVELEKLLKEKEWEFWLYNILKDYAFSTSVTDDICKSILDEDGPKRFLSGNGEWICMKERGLIKVYNNLAAPAPLKIDTMVIGKKNWRTRREITQICPTLYLDADKIALPLSFKVVEAGERFSPLGLRGSKKVTDYLTDIKFENLHKGNVILICDASGKIVCIPGLQISDHVKVTEGTRRILKVYTR